MELTYTISLAVVASSISILIWVWFWTRKQELNNKSAIFVFVGGTVALILALLFQKVLDILIPNTTITAVFLRATVEEILKLSVVLGAIKFLKIDRSRIVIYMIVVALGFAALENVLFIAGSLIGEDVTGGAITGNVRFVVSSLLHVVSSGIIGIALAFSFHKSGRKRVIIITLGLILAIIIHAVFNIFMSHGGENGHLFSASITWILSLILVYIVFKKGRKIPKKEVWVFVLIIILSIYGGGYMDAKLPKYTPEVLISWQKALKDVEKSQDFLEGVGSNFAESISTLDSIHSQLQSMLVTMEENKYLSLEERKFMENYDDLIFAYNEKAPKYSLEVIASWQAQLKGTDDVRASYFDTGPNFTESLKALDSIRSQLRQIVKTMEENRNLSSDQQDFLSSYNAYVDQYICILRKQEVGDSIENCKF